MTTKTRTREYRAFPQLVATKAASFDNVPTKEKIVRPSNATPKPKDWQ